MSQDEQSYSEAKAEQQEHIARLREGDKNCRRLGKILARCSRGNWCNHKECAVCVRRMNRAARKIGSVVELIYGTDDPCFQVRTILLDSVKVVGKRRTLDEKKLVAVAASMSQIGLRMPITVRTRKKHAILVTGLHRLEAARRLGWTKIPVFTIPGDEIEARPWELAENLYRAELTVLERAEHIDELRVIIRRGLKGGRLHHLLAANSPRTAELTRPPRHWVSPKKKSEGRKKSLVFRRRPRKKPKTWGSTTTKTLSSRSRNCRRRRLSAKRSG